MRSSRKQPTGRHSGAVLVWVVLSLAGIIGVVAINIDGGRLMEERRRAQSAADAAALAAGASLYANYPQYQGLDTYGSAAAAATAAAEAFGYPSTAVTVNVPPQSGTFKGQAGYAEVYIQSSVAATFGQIFTSTGIGITARSCARGQPLNIGIVVLNSTGAGAFTNNALLFTLLNAPIVVNSSDPAAFDQTSIGAAIATQYKITGGYANPGGALFLGSMYTGVSPISDPLAFLATPSSAGAAVQSNTPTVINSILPVILQPGVYRGGISIKGASVVTMLPGVYIMQGGGFQVSGLATVVGLTVMIYNTTDTTYAAGPVSITSVGKVVLTAPLTGTYQGIGIFQDRSLTNQITMTGAGLAAITGLIYAAQAPANLTGSAVVGVDLLGGAFVVASMKVSGVGAININIGLNPPRVPDVRLVE